MHDDPPRGRGIIQVWFTFNDPHDDTRVLSGQVGKFTSAQWQAIINAAQHELDMQKARETQETEEAQ